MEFFKLAHDYEFEVAKVGIKKMLHLIWTEDNKLTSGDGKMVKGVRFNLPSPLFRSRGGFVTQAANQ
ncbi:Condensin complex subunit [Tulasnella sp. 418]|nr:Condensin complex subunit [Tulasnella sp. 418]